MSTYSYKKCFMMLTLWMALLSNKATADAITFSNGSRGIIRLSIKSRYENRKSRPTISSIGWQLYTISPSS